MKKAIIAALLLGVASQVQAHEVWVERDGAGPARIYLGEPGDVLPEGGDPEFDKLQKPKIVGAVASSVPARKAGFIEVALAPGDVRVTDDSVFAPWGEEGKKEGIVYYARAGRQDTQGKLPLEIVPVRAGGDTFTLLWKGAPVPNAKLTVITPDKWSRAFQTDAKGQVRFTKREAGRYILTAVQEEKDVEHGGAKLATLYHNTTLSFVE